MEHEFRFRAEGAHSALPKFPILPRCTSCLSLRCGRRWRQKLTGQRKLKPSLTLSVVLQEHDINETKWKSHPCKFKCSLARLSVLTATEHMRRTLAPAATRAASGDYLAQHPTAAKAAQLCTDRWHDQLGPTRFRGASCLGLQLSSASFRMSRVRFTFCMLAPNLSAPLPRNSAWGYRLAAEPSPLWLSCKGLCFTDAKRQVSTDLGESLKLSQAWLQIFLLLQRGVAMGYLRSCHKPNVRDSTPKTRQSSTMPRHFELAECARCFHAGCRTHAASCVFQTATTGSMSPCRELLKQPPCRGEMSHRSRCLSFGCFRLTAPRLQVYRSSSDFARCFLG